MSTKGVTRAEAKKFGLIDRDRQIYLPKLSPPNDVILWEPEEELTDRCGAHIRFVKQVSMFGTLAAESGSETLRAEAARIRPGAFATFRSGKSRVFSAQTRHCQSGKRSQARDQIRPG